MSRTQTTIGLRDGLLGIALAAGLGALAAGCGPGDWPDPFIPGEGECSPMMSREGGGDLVIVPEEELAGDVELGAHFSPRALRTANVCGLIPLLRRHCAAPPDPIQRLSLRQELDERLAVVALEISSTSASLDCEEERADQIADYLLEIASSRRSSLTLISVFVGAVGTVITGVLALRKVDHRVYRTLGILFGLAVATISVMALRSEEAVVEFTHRSNMLAELYRRPERPTLFPASVWGYLNLEDEDDDGGAGRGSLRDRLLDRWRKSGELGAMDGAERRRLMALLLGPGGPYRATELRIRANLLDQFESYVNLMKADLRNLAREFSASAPGGPPP